MYKTDNESLNRLVTIINVNAHLLDETTVRELQDVYRDLVNDYILFEQEVDFNEQLLEENEQLKSELLQKQ